MTVAAVAATHGLQVTVLRLLSVESAAAETASNVSILAQLDSPDRVPPGVALAPVAPHLLPTLADDPLRQPYARPGGPQREIEWADRVLARLERPRTGRPEQQRTWNLSAIWRLPTAQDSSGSSAFPGFFAHEASMLAAVSAVTSHVPTVLAAGPGRLLLEDVPGVDLYEATTEQLLEVVHILVGIQVALAPGGEALMATGCFDWREGTFVNLAGDVVERTSPELDTATRDAAKALLGDLPGMFGSLGRLRPPDTLVHGDFHPGNIRSTEGHLVVFDWGDSGFGHPLLDRPALLDRVPAADLPAVSAAWSAAWRAAVPGCDPEGAARLIGPVAALRQAIVYRLFLDGIERTERVYHAEDPAIWVRRATGAFLEQA